MKLYHYSHEKGVFHNFKTGRSFSIGVVRAIRDAGIDVTIIYL